MIRLKKCGIKEFEKITENSPIVCFCAGQRMKEFCERFHIEDGILYAVDNYKHGQTMRIGNVEIPVISMTQLDGRCRNAVCVLTSIQYADAIMKQLDENPICDGMDVYVYELLQEESKTVEKKLNRTQIIPKTIHYCWFGNKPIPREFQENIETWRQCCPDYEIIQWNESNYDIAKNRYMCEAYEHEKWGFVPDYARLDIINTYGGVYLDTDVQMLRSFDDLLMYRMFCGFECAEYVAFGLGFGAEKNHPILEEMLDEYERVGFVNDDGSLNMKPSPVYQTTVLKKHGLRRTNTVQEQEDYIVFPTEYFAPINEYGHGQPTVNTYSIHQYAGTWFDNGQRELKQRIMDNYALVLKRIIDRDIK